MRVWTYFVISLTLQLSLFCYGVINVLNVNKISSEVVNKGSHVTYRWVSAKRRRYAFLALTHRYLFIVISQSRVTWYCTKHDINKDNTPCPCGQPVCCNPRDLRSKMIVIFRERTVSWYPISVLVLLSSLLRLENPRVRPPSTWLLRVPGLHNSSGW